jgi:molybdopterin-containing oxidoreductase family iron-sulfur binding subunit
MSHDHDHEAPTQALDAGAADNAAAARQYFRSLDQLADTPEYRASAEREFPEGASEWNDEFSRRKFLGLVAASVALAGLQSCRKPFRKILPFAAQPEGVTPGIPSWYATSYVSGGYGYGTVVRSNDGRPTKVEGNKLHPGSLGAADQYMQADVLSLYDPARSTQPRHKGAHAAEGDAADDGGHGGHGAPIGENPLVAAAKKARHDLEGFLTPHCAAIRAKFGEGVRFLLEPSTSPTLRGLIEKKARQVLPKATFHYFSAIHRQQEIEGGKIAFGNALDTHLLLDNADCVVSFRVRLPRPRDRLARQRAPLLQEAQDHRAGRQRVAPLRRRVDLHGHRCGRGPRFRLPACQVADAALALAATLFLTNGVAFEGLTDELKNALRPHLEHAFKTKKGKDWIAVAASDLVANRGRSCVVAGATAAAGRPCGRPCDQQGARQPGQDGQLPADRSGARGRPATLDPRARCRARGGQGRDAVSASARTPSTMPGRARLRRQARERPSTGSTSACTMTRPRRPAIGTSTRRTTSRPGATSAPTTARSRSSSR